MGGPSLKERLPFLGAILGRRAREEREQEWETGRGLVEAEGKSVLDRLAARFKDPFFYESTNDSPYALVLCWGGGFSTDELKPSKGIMLTVLNGGVKVAYSAGFGLWTLLENSRRYQTDLATQENPNISLATKIGYAVDYATENFGQALRRVTVEGTVIKLHEIGFPEKMAV